MVRPSQRTFDDLGVRHAAAEPAPPRDPVGYSIDQADAVEWLRGKRDESFDLVATDPAYESLEKHRAVGTTTRLKASKGSSNEWFPTIPNARLPELMAEFYRVLRPDRHCYVMCDHETAFFLKPAGEAAGFKFWKPLVWVKGGGIGMGYHYRAKYEFVMFFEKGKRRLNDLGIPDVIEADRVWRKFPTEKPTALFEVLIRQSTQPGELVVDPFVGSGTTAVAALSLGRNFLGCDLTEKAVKWSRGRVEEWLARGVGAAPAP